MFGPTVTVERHTTGGGSYRSRPRRVVTVRIRTHRDMGGFIGLIGLGLAVFSGFVLTEVPSPMLENPILWLAIAGLLVGLGLVHLYLYWNWSHAVVTLDEQTVTVARHPFPPAGRWSLPRDQVTRAVRRSKIRHSPSRDGSTTYRNEAWFVALYTEDAIRDLCEVRSKEVATTASVTLREALEELSGGPGGGRP